MAISRKCNRRFLRPNGKRGECVNETYFTGL